METVNGREYTVELRSVNNRYLDCTVKLPRTLSFAEDAVKQAVKATISRGKVDVFISLRAEGTQDVKISLNAPVVEGYLAAMRQMVDAYGVRDDISVSTLSQLPDVFTVEKPEVDEEALQADLMGVVDKALTQYDAMRSPKAKPWKRPPGPGADHFGTGFPGGGRKRPDRHRLPHPAGKQAERSPGKHRHR